MEEWQGTAIRKFGGMGGLFGEITEFSLFNCSFPAVSSSLFLAQEENTTRDNWQNTDTRRNINKLAIDVYILGGDE